MTPLELLNLISSDPQAASRFAFGDDAGVAARCIEIAPLMSVPSGYTYLGLIAIDVSMTRRLMISMAAVGVRDPVVAFLDDCFRGKNPQSGFPGVDVEMLGPLLTGLVEADVENGLQQADITAITDLAKQPQQITADMVSETRNL